MSHPQEEAEGIIGKKAHGRSGERRRARNDQVPRTHPQGKYRDAPRIKGVKNRGPSIKRGFWRLSYLRSVVQHYRENVFVCKRGKVRAGADRKPEGLGMKSHNQQRREEERYINPRRFGAFGRATEMKRNNSHETSTYPDGKTHKGRETSSASSRC